jgi:hypothetical protein
MLPRSEAIISEEFIFFFDLTTDFLKKKTVMKAISSFIKEKNKFNALSTFGVLIFQKDDNPISEYDLKDSDSVLNTINNSWDARETEQSYLENGLYEILAYIFRKSRKARKNYRVIIISDAPSKLSEDYYNALYDLLIKAKKFSAFIDIIRVGNEKFYEDDVKLKVISSETYGGMFYCQDEKLLQNVLGSLVQNKKEFNILKTEDSDQILKEDKAFYERLAVDLISLSPDDEEICTICEQELCPICEAHSDEIHKCFNCDTKYHSCCAAKYAIARNIGFINLFRCLNCETLLKIDEEFVNMVYQEDLEEGLPEIDLESPIIEKPLTEEYKQESIIEQYGSKETIDEVGDHQPSPGGQFKKVRVGGYFGREITINPKNAKNNVVSQPPELIEPTESQISITSLNPPRKRGSTTIKLCHICGATLQNTNYCPKCGAKID